MYKKILVATDGSELAEAAVDHGIGLAKAVGAKLVFVTVTEMWSALGIASEIERGKLKAVDAYEEAAHAAAEKVLNAARDKAVQAGLAADTRHVRDERPAEGIMETAELEEADLIIMASHGRRGVNKVLLGSQTAEVLSFCKTPVLVLR